MLVQHVVQFQLLFGFAGVGWFHRLFLTGYDGVVLFFVLSGFLITYLLLAERDRTGSIDVQRFYVRRILRIWPLYFLLIAVASATYIVFGRDIPGWPQPDHAAVFAFYVLLLANVAVSYGTPVLGISQAWSIAVEEQFYVVWPWLLSVFARGLLRFMLAVVVVKVAVLWILVATQGNGSRTVLFVRDLAFESMAIGALAAVVVLRRSWLVSVMFHPLTQVAALAAFGASVYLQDRFLKRVPAAGTTLLSLVLALLIVNVGCNTRSLLRLSHPLLDYLGRISYGIYMFHPLCIYGIFLTLSKLGWDPGTNHLLLAAAYALAICGTIAISAVSYRFFETPFLRLKKRFAHIESGGDTLPVSGFAGSPAPVATTS